MHRARENQSGKREPEPRPLLANNTIQYSFIDNKQLSIWHIMRGGYEVFEPTRGQET